MASVVLAASNHASFASSIWSDWASSPCDLHMLAEVRVTTLLDFQLSQDGMIEAHSGMLFPMSRYLTAVVETLPFFAGPIQVTDGHQIAS